MDNRVTVEVGGAEYTIITDEEPSYVRSLAERINKEISSSSHSTMHASVLCCIKFLDMYHKAEESANNLRSQIKDFLEASQKHKVEMAEIKRENTKLKESLKNAQNKN